MGLSVIAVDTGAEKKKMCMDAGASAWVDFKETKDIVKAYVLCLLLRVSTANPVGSKTLRQTNSVLMPQ